MSTADYGVIFDMDGVLVDSYKPHFISWQETCAERGLTISPEDFARLFGRSFLSFAEALTDKPLPEAELARWYEEKEGRYRELIADDFPAMDGVEELLQNLAANGFALAIGSSGPRANVDCVAKNIPDGKLFQTTVSGDDVDEGKPAPDIFLKCAENLRIPPAKCAVIEDSLPGIEAAKRADMAAIALVGTSDHDELSKAANMVVHSLRELDAQRIARLIDETSGKE